ncbi:MAG: DUF1206 domain-containing protein [Acetobacteraceae bacterium]
MADSNRLELFARFGYAARGAVNLIVGVLALLAAVGRGGEATGSKGALQSLLAQPLGEALLAVVALGLFGFAFWRALQSLLDADGMGRNAKALAVRAGQAVSAVVYVSLGIFALSLLFGWGQGSSGEQSADDWTAMLLEQPFGRWLVAAAGIAIGGVALGLGYRAWSASFAQHLAPETPGWVVRLGRIGYAARGVVFLMVAGFLIIAAWQADPSEARGLGGALRALQDQPFGWALFSLVALGLTAFGVFEFAVAYYRRINAPDEQKAIDAAKARVG